VVPGGPYASTKGALGAIRRARESGQPFLGTCAGFQHAVLEYARHVWQIPEAAHAELDPDAADPVIGRLACSLVEVTAPIRLIAGTRLAAWYGKPTAIERYHCNYGVNPGWQTRLENGPLRIAARDETAEIRAVELDGHPFFVATLFQPERSALADADHPLIQAFVAATATV
jgi:CTP synthase (UTP-ammonia lyase)